MAVQFAAEVLDTLLAPGISGFSSADVPHLGDHPQSQHWLSNLFLNSLFRARYNDAWKQAAITLIFRSQNAIRAYERARADTLACAAAFAPGGPAVELYFRALAEWETVLLNVQIAVDVFEKVIDPSAVRPEESGRLLAVANRIKHFGEDIQKDRNTPELTLPVWLTEVGLQSRTAAVSFAEIAEHVDELAKAADVLQDPASDRP